MKNRDMLIRALEKMDDDTLARLVTLEFFSCRAVHEAMYGTSCKPGDDIGCHGCPLIDRAQAVAWLVDDDDRR